MTSVSQLPRVYVQSLIPPKGLARLRQHCQVTVYEGEDRSSREELLRQVQGVDGLIVHPWYAIDKEVLDTAGPQLKVVSSFSVGLDHIDLGLCKERGVKVGYTPGVLSTAVAEHLVGLTLATVRRYNEAIKTVHNGEWGNRWESALWLAGKQLSNSTIGIVGLGRIGLAAAKRFKAFEPAKILYTGRNPRPESAGEVDAEFVPFEQLLEKSDFVVAACSVHADNKNLFDKVAFTRIKPGAVFVNVTRGSLVDQDALLSALTEGRLGAAGLDVTTPEPLPLSHPLLALPNVMITPHIGSATHESRNGMCELAVDNLLAGLRGEPLKTPAYD